MEAASSPLLDEYLRLTSLTTGERALLIGLEHIPFAGLANHNA